MDSFENDIYVPNISSVYVKQTNAHQVNHLHTFVAFDSPFLTCTTPNLINANSENGFSKPSKTKNLFGAKEGKKKKKKKKLKCKKYKTLSNVVGFTLCNLFYISSFSFLYIKTIKLYMYMGLL